MNINQKNVVKVLAVILLLLVVIGYFAFKKSQTVETSRATETVETVKTPQITETTKTIPQGNEFSVTIDGYFQTCTNSSSMSRFVDGVWEKVSTDLPERGLYYLDDTFIGYGGCDVAVCAELPKPYTRKLVEYKKIGEKAPPSNSGSTLNTLPVFQTTPISGDVKVDIQYFSDKSCQNKKTFSTVIKR